MEDINNVPSTQDFVQGQFGSEDAALNNLVMEMRSREDPLAIYQRLSDEAGIPGLQSASKTLSGQINNLEDRLALVEPDIAARSRESLVTEAQKRALIGEAQKPINEQLGKFGTALGRIRQGIGDALQGIGTQTGLTLQGQAQNLEPLQLVFQTQVDRNSRLASAFNRDKEVTLENLRAKRDQGFALDRIEKQQLAEAEAAERDYRRRLATSAAKLGISINEGMSNSDLLESIGIGSVMAQEWENL